MTAMSLKEEGDRLYKSQNFVGAVDQYTKAINSTNEQDPSIYVCFSNRCACYLQLNDFYKALYDANQCIRLKPSWPKGYNRRGSCLIRLNRMDEAYEAYEKALQFDSNNVEAINALAKLRQGSSSSNSSNNNNSTNSPRTSSTGNNFMSTLKDKAMMLYQQFSSMDWTSIGATVSAFITAFYHQCNSYWERLSADTRRYIQIGLVVLLVYYFFFYRSSSSYDYYPEYSSGYSSGYNSGYGYGGYGGGYGYGYGGGGGGLSWTMWAAIMFGAYKVPPMLPDLLGDYARPFFGMNWTTFMWLLNMMTSNRGGGRFMGPGMGRGFGGGGLFGGRRRY